MKLKNIMVNSYACPPVLMLVRLLVFLLHTLFSVTHGWTDSTANVYDCSRKSKWKCYIQQRQILICTIKNQPKMLTSKKSYLNFK